MTARERGLVCAWLWTAATLVVVHSIDGGILRLLAAAPLVLFLPGYALLCALRFDARSTLEWNALAAGLSIGLAIVGGFVLDALHFLTPQGWSAWCAGLVLVMSAIAFARGKSPEGPAEPVAMRFRVRHGVVLGVAALLVAGALTVAARDAATYREFKYTEFWMLPGKHQSSEVVLGVASAEAETRTFDIEVTLDGHTVAAFRSIRLAPGERFGRQVALPLRPGRPEKAEAWLINSDDHSQIYRKTSLWVGGRS